MEPQLLNTKQAAKIVGLSHRTMERLRLVGGGPTYVKLGTRVLYSPADLAAWVQAHRRTSTSDGKTGGA